MIREACVSWGLEEGELINISRAVKHGERRAGKYKAVKTAANRIASTNIGIQRRPMEMSA